MKYRIILSKEINKYILLDFIERLNVYNTKIATLEQFKKAVLEKPIGSIFIDFEENSDYALDNNEYIYIPVSTMLFSKVSYKYPVKYYLNQADILRYITFNNLFQLTLYEFLETIKEYKGELICL